MCKNYEDNAGRRGIYGGLKQYKALSRGRGLGEGKSKKEESLLNPPHPNLLPQGEGVHTLKSTALGSKSS
jgi:hypothetical protein